MCGVWGIVKKGKHSVFTVRDEDFLAACAVAGQLRGVDSVGLMAGVGNKGKSKVVKAVEHPYNFMRRKEVTDIFTYAQGKDSPTFVFGHNRAATKGEVTPKNAHPFRVGSITLMHNGTLSNALPAGEDVDSRWVATRLSTEDPQDVIGSLTGAYVFIWHDARDNTLNIIKNGQRPLFYLEHGNKIYYASEQGMLAWLWRRHVAFSAQEQLPQIYYPKIDVFYKLNLDNGGVVETPLKKPVYPVATTYGGHSSAHSYNGYSPSYRNTAKLPMLRTPVEFCITDASLFKLHDKDYHRWVGLSYDDCDLVVIQAPHEIQFHFDQDYSGVVEGETWIKDLDGNYTKHLVIGVESVIEMDRGAIDVRLILSDDTKMSVAEFEDKAKKGCTLCKKPVHLEEATSCTHHSSGTGVICPDCTDWIANEHQATGKRYVHSVH